MGTNQQAHDWAAIFGEAADLGVRFEARMPTVEDLREQLGELGDQAQAILDIADDEDRDLTDEEQAEFDHITAEAIPDVQAKIEHRQKFDQQTKTLAAARRESGAVSNPLDTNGALTAPKMPQIRMLTPKLQAFTGENGIRDAYECGMWLRGVIAHSRGQHDAAAHEVCQRRGWDVRATATEGTDSAGGYTTPVELSNSIINVRGIAGVSRRLARVIPMSSDVMNVAKKTGSTTVQYTAEAAAITATDQTFGNVQLVAAGRKVLSKVSAELQADSVLPSFMDDLAVEIGSDLALREDVEFIDADGTAGYGSALGVSQVGSAGVYTAGANDDTWPELDLSDFTGTIALVPHKYHVGQLSWLCSAAFYHTVMLRLEAVAGGNTFATIAAGDSGARFLGYPVVMTDAAPTATAADTIACYFGNFRAGVLIGDRSGIQLAFSSERYFDEDALAVRAVSRYDLRAHDIGDGSSAGAVVALKTAA